MGNSDNRVTELAYFINQQMASANDKMNAFSQTVATSYSTLHNNVQTMAAQQDAIIPPLTTLAQHC